MILNNRIIAFIILNDQYMKKLLPLLLAMILISCGKQETFTLWQLSSQVNTIGNSYVIRTANDKIIVMDGGTNHEKDYLRGFIEALGGKVDMWFLSHPHGDHIGAVTAILQSLNRLEIKQIYHSRFTEELIDCEKGCAEATRKFYAMLDNLTDIEVIDCHCGDIFELDGVKIKVLAEKNPEMADKDYNNSSMVVKVWDKQKSIIFLGDLGPIGGQKLLKSEYAEDLKCDYLQMAHHGQAGCDKEFYDKTEFRACLWPTPSWVYDNDQGGGYNTGRLKTMEVREWMKEKGITEHYLSFEGLTKIE